jgi:hypothetical protein
MADFSKTFDNTTDKKLPPIQKIEFYSLGKETKNPSLHINHNNKGFAVILSLFRTPLLIFMKGTT